MWGILKSGSYDGVTSANTDGASKLCPVIGLSVDIYAAEIECRICSRA
jgi:hypothetical protein